MGSLWNLIRRRVRRDGDAKGRQPLEKPGRVRTISLFNNTNSESFDALKKMVHFTALASPKPDAWRRPPMPQESSSTGSSCQTPPKITHISDEMHDVLIRLFDDLRGKDEQLSKKKFTAFLQSSQGETEPEQNLDHDEYTLGDFLYTWMMFYSRGVRPLPPKDLSKPLTNYFISSSHNTYQVGNQLASKSSPDTYRNVLQRGCRCIEIDVWNGEYVAMPQTLAHTHKAEHHRGNSTISGSSLPFVATAVFDTVEETFVTYKNYVVGDKPGSTRSRSNSSNSRAVGDDPSPRSSVVFGPDPKESGDFLDAPKSPRPRSRPRLPRGEPIVTHGWTLTAPCGFREVCEAVKDSAFIDNDLPVIVSLEVHADDSQQEVMVKIMKEVWGDMLIDEPFEGCDPRFRVPKLEDLRNKILVKVKKAPVKMMDSRGSVNIPPTITVDDESSDSDDDLPPRGPQKSASEPIGATPTDRNKSSFPICQALGDLAVYTRSERFHGFDTPQAKKPTHIFSVSENRILQLGEKQHSDLFRHNKNYFMRAFPAGRRIDSSNPDPSLFWRKGVQMVAMNWQNLDEGMMLNQGMFADENGWVLKPLGYRSCDKTTMTQDEAQPGRTMDLTITVFAGQHIPLHGDEEEEATRASGDLRPFVKLELHVQKGEAIKSDGQVSQQLYKMKTDPGKTDHPEFGRSGKTLRFLHIPKVVEELSFIRFKIEDDARTGFSSPMLAWACVRLDRLRQGYRFINLLDMRGRPVEGGKLLIRVVKTMR